VSTEDGPPPELAERLGYLFKHAQSRLTALTAEALAPHGVSAREVAVLAVLAGAEPASQQQAARRLGIDRTSMVAFVDALEARGLVARSPDPDDRRRNVVAVTAKGRETLRRADRARTEAERRFLAPLSRSTADALRRALTTLAREPGRPERL